MERTGCHPAESPYWGPERDPDYRERFQGLPSSQQLGNIASTLSRIGRQAGDVRDDALVAGLLREAAVLIEWSAPQAAPAVLPELARLQRELLTWWRRWPVEPAREILALYARHRSEQLLEMAGLVGPRAIGDR